MPTTELNEDGYHHVVWTTEEIEELIKDAEPVTKAIVAKYWVPGWDDFASNPEHAKSSADLGLTAGWALVSLPGILDLIREVGYDVKEN